MRITRHRAAIRRSAGSKPIQWLLSSGYLSTDRTFFDYGCGHGDDVSLLRSLGFRADGWDPHFSPDEKKVASDVVNLGFVLNVIEDPAERGEVLRDAWTLTRRLLVVTVRASSDEPQDPGRPYGDGFVTGLGTFQKFFSSKELRQVVEDTLQTRSVPITPGSVAVFRDQRDRQEYAARRLRRVRRATATPEGLAMVLYQEHRVLLDPLIEWVGERGRFPRDVEWSGHPELLSTLGSKSRIRGVVRAVMGSDWLEDVQREAAEDLLVFLALERFGGRPRFSSLHPTLQLDIRSHFGSYTRACARSDNLLESLGNPLIVDANCRDSQIGKLTGSALYVHRSALERLDAGLRVYEGCARAMLGEVEGANLLKFHRRSPAISYLSYPDFDTVAHPALQWSYHVDLRDLKATFTDYSHRDNPPILHRKEEFVDDEYPGRKVFASLTRREEARGLLDEVSRIGYLRGWEEVLENHSVRIGGHRIYEASPDH